MGVGLPEFPDSVPDNVRTALEAILTDVYSEDVRNDIVTALTWGMENSLVVGKFVNSLGLTVEDGLLCYTTKDVFPTYDEIPEDVQGPLDRILTDVYGVDLRRDITEALRWGAGYTSMVGGFIEDLGLTVVDGKLCAIYGWENP